MLCPMPVKTQWMLASADLATYFRNPGENLFMYSDVVTRQPGNQLYAILHLFAFALSLTEIMLK